MQPSLTTGESYEWLEDLRLAVAVVTRARPRRARRNRTRTLSRQDQRLQRLPHAWLWRIRRHAGRVNLADRLIHGLHGGLGHDISIESAADGARPERGTVAAENTAALPAP